MVVLEEDIVNHNCDYVYYQAPEDLKVPKDPEPDVVHDDHHEYDEHDHHHDHDHHHHHDDYEYDHHHEDYDDDDDDYEKYHDYASTINDDKLDEDIHHHDVSPIEAIRMMKCNPHSVRIIRMNGKYYIDHNDMRCYMDACGESNYEYALNNIIAAHNEDGLTRDCACIVVGENEMLKLDPETKFAMESSDVEFEVYE